MYYKVQMDSTVQKAKEHLRVLHETTVLGSYRLFLLYQGTILIVVGTISIVHDYCQITAIRPARMTNKLMSNWGIDFICFILHSLE